MLDAMASDVEFSLDRADNRLLVSTVRMVLYPTEHKPDPPAKPQMMTNWGFNAMWFLLNFGSPKVSHRPSGTLITPEAARSKRPRLLTRLAARAWCRVLFLVRCQACDVVHHQLVPSKPLDQGPRQGPERDPGQDDWHCPPSAEGACVHVPGSIYVTVPAPAINRSGSHLI